VEFGWWKVRQTQPAVRYVAGWQRLLVAGLLILLAIVLWAALIGLWPAITNAAAARPRSSTSFPLAFGLWRPKVSGETALFVLVLIASLLGSIVHVASSFSAHSAQRDLTVSYLWWYPMRLVVGAGLALLLYTALRGGLFSADFNSKQVNPYGVAAAAGLTGMFSKQATAKLAQLFDVAFNVRTTKGPPTIQALDPPNLTAGQADATLTVTGTGFENGATATGNDTAIEVTYVSDTELKIVVPAALSATPGTIKIRVDNPDPTVGASAPVDLPVAPLAGNP
jgi:hypothetical protein